MTARYRAFRICILLIAALSSISCQAIDNPDAPNYLGQFRSEAANYEDAIYQEAATTSQAVDEYRKYINFLEGEIEAAETAVENELSEPDKLKLADAMAAWKSYRDAEGDFIAGVWTPENFGSSSAFSRLAFYAEILKSRVELLLKYRAQF